ncbi:alpha/beta fold hydrolase [Actinopolymorpha alba]|uniref:alpha/beta fold hydrolase n=1 Tax=Actinopolymorpha alba TaxID=533267 RepID=UPI0003629A75|nr:alpha/beta hydrolase [Actinopolymorpha alba]
MSVVSRGAYRVVILPGLAGCEAEWIAVTTELDVPAEVVASAVPGFLPAPSLEHVVDAAEAVLDASPEPVVVVAQSMGAMPAEALAMRRPDRLAGMVLADPSVEPSPARWTAALAPGAESLGSVAGRLPEAVTARLGLAFRRATIRFGAQTADPLDRDAILRAFGTPAALAAQVRGFGRYYRWAVELADLRYDVLLRKDAALTLPTRLLVAADSRAESVRHQHWLAARFRPHAEIFLVEGSRHLMHLDRPDVVRDAVRAVLAARS